MKIIDWFKGKIIIILLILLGLAGGVMVVQYISGLKDENKIVQLEQDKKTLQQENATLTSQVDNLNRIRESENAALAEMQAKLDELAIASEDSIKELETISERASDKNVNINSALPDDLVRLLNSHCNKVRGRNCSNP